MTREEKIKKIVEFCNQQNYEIGCRACVFNGKKYAICYEDNFAQVPEQDLDEILEVINNKEQEKKKMTVEELVQVLDKNRRFIIRACHTDKTIFHPVKDEEKWEMFRRKEVVQFTPVEDGIIIYVAPPVRKDS